MFPFIAVATSLEPSLEEATSVHCRPEYVALTQVMPESALVQTTPLPASATSFEPSLEEATADQDRLVSRAVQVAPESALV